MLRALDFMGVLKWPSLAAVTLLPAVSFAFWGDFDDATPLHLHGPEQVGGMPVLLSRPADARVRDGETRWCVRPCAECGARLSAISLGYGGASVAAGDWVEAEADGAQACATLSPAGRSEQVWIRITALEGGEATRAWTLGATP